MRIDELIEDFEFLDTSEERYRYIIDLGKDLPRLEDAEKVEQNRVYGCQSRVWMVANQDGGTLNLRADSDAFIVRGLISVLMAMYDGQPVASVPEIDAKGIFATLGLEAQLSQGRRNGLYSMVKRIQTLSS